MRIAIDTIPDDGVHVDLTAELPWAVDAATSVIESAVSVLHGHLHVERRGTSARVRGSVSAAGQRICERCGESTALTLSSEPDLDYVPAEDVPPGHTEVRLAAGDLDIGWFQAGILDLSDVLSEALALALPPRIACSDTPPCDARVAAMLEAQSGPSDDHPFAALRGSFNDA
ncbi:MAG: DUF177 domain-containing protein [Myxococcota bacterium]